MKVSLSKSEKNSEKSFAHCSNLYTICWLIFAWQYFFTSYMTHFAISADVRAASEKTSHIRKDQKVPGVVYGKTHAPIALCVDSSEFLRLYRKAGKSSIINLSVGKEKLEVLIHETQKHPVTGAFTHVDFYAITRGQKVNAAIKLNFVGSAPAEKEGAVIQEMIREIEVHTLPRNLVDHFDVDLSLLKEDGDTIRVSDLGLDPEKYEHHHEADDVVALAALPRAVVESDEDDSVEAAEEADSEDSSEEK